LALKDRASSTPPSPTPTPHPSEAGHRIGAMIAALLSDENRWVTAQRIEVSGGMFL
jgi:NAD(P)-dependent dehydrogenase (short-subunit alcohol dehydrogenase family)